MAFFDRMLDVMNLGDEDDEYYDDDEMYDDDYDDYEDDGSEKSGFHLFGNKKEKESEPVEKTRPVASVREKPVVKQSPKITPMRGSKKGNTTSMEVCVIKPSSFEDAREISETLLADRTVILNMEGLDLGLAQRIIDFTSGCCYAIDGNLQKVSNYIFIITPSIVDISGDLQGIVDAFDFSGIQTGF
jgi:cell division inhibitor SepF